MIFVPSSIQTQRFCRLEKLGLMNYQLAWDYQKSLVAERKVNPMLEDVLLLLEHPAVYTLGTGSTTDFLKFDPQDSPHEIYRIERGGEVTYHCPGQLVGYPILNLRFYQPDLHWYLRQLEEVILQVLQSYDLPAERLDGLTGVWVKGYKIASIGIKVSRWITMHGFSINVCPDLTGFTHIIPCGIIDKPVGSIKQFLPEITLNQVQELFVQIFSQVFQIQILTK